MKNLSRIHIILALLAFIFSSKLKGQAIRIIGEPPELVPYMIVPLDPEPDCRLELGIELVAPYAIQHSPTVQQQETLDIIYKRISYEIVNPNRQAGMFQIDGKLYHLIRIPYTGASEDYDMGWE
tara:strand:- start:64 stop:435 length:372 start_codon:yes stop_codon:yes gene_type:complete